MNSYWPLLVFVVMAGCVSLPPVSGSSTGDEMSGERCHVVAERKVAFSSDSAQDVVEVRASGIDCAKAVVTVSIRHQNGLPVAAFAMPFVWLHGEIEPTQMLAREALSRLLHTYVDDVQLDRGASTLPVWQRGVRTPGFEQGLELTSPLFRKDYEVLRKAKPNMLCLGDAFETGVCYVWNAKQARAEVILRR